MLHSYIKYGCRDLFKGLEVLCIAGLAGIYYCATSGHTYAGTTKAFVIKTVCFILSVAAIFLCIIACTFPAIHLGRIFTYDTCLESANDCRCFLSPGQESRVFVYSQVKDCHVLFDEIKLYLIIVGSLCLLGSTVSLWFVILLWKARYGKFYSGLRTQLSQKSTDTSLP